jgi:hypothetical protein
MRSGPSTIAPNAREVVSDRVGPVVREAVNQFNPGFGTRDDNPRLPLQLQSHCTRPDSS